jgi:putative flippase GtrA
MTGNLLLTRPLVGAAHLPVLAANGIAILVCSVINFWLGHAWAFATRVPVMQDRAPQEV